MKVGPRFGLYGIITEPVVGYERLAAMMVERGVPFIQLRMKDSPVEETLAMARRLRAVIPLGGGTRFIVNDSIEIARESGADGVHLGQDDAPLRRARELLGQSAIIGLSTHNTAQTLTACAERPDYIGVGPVYATPTKAKADPVIGLQGMREMLAAATVPAVAIGGIDLARARAVLEAGARNLCVVRYINRSESPADRIEELLNLLKEYSER